ncbi:MAG: potassium-transporting ATPase subunit KdpC [Hymenobacteraceae bacterium]|nr:potassium-transporting ATPase subunit KdpC [Hymenobacteraceae bacterium]
MKLLRQSLVLSLLLLVLCSVAYPLLLNGLAQLAPGHGTGETLAANGRVVGFARVGQRFTQARYFNSRPSAVDYNAAGSAGSNKAPSNPEYRALVKARLDTFLLRNPGVTAAEVPGELLTASGSGLDPDLSPQGALVQVPRVAKARGVSSAVVRALVEAHVERPVLGAAHVNLLALNGALDKLPPGK